MHIREAHLSRIERSFLDCQSVRGMAVARYAYIDTLKAAKMSGLGKLFYKSYTLPILKRKSITTLSLFKKQRDITKQFSLSIVNIITKIKNET